MRIFILTILILVGLANIAQARNYVYSDDDFRFNVMFSDQWRRVTGFAPYERIRVIAPGEGNPHCVVTAEQDRRFVIYPKRYYKNIMTEAIQWPYWQDLTAQLDERFFYFFKEGGASYSDARTTLVDYTVNPESDAPEYRRALIYAGIYKDVHMVALCDAPEDKWDDHLQSFNEFIESIHFEPRYHPLFNAYYRDFLEEEDYSARKDDRTWIERQLGLNKPLPMEFERQHRSEY